MVSNGTEFVVGDIERLFDEARRSTKAKHEKWAKYYHRSRRKKLTVNVYQKVRTEETVMPNTSGYNLRPRTRPEIGGPDRPMRRGHNKEDQFESEEAQNTSVQPLHCRASKVKQQEYQKQK
ncbi:hypothetical protein TNCV_4298861 [Trichonephila clavipes]|nr:hypothetical protein TNCV_4298861 [Trichonephila clavipes]